LSTFAEAFTRRLSDFVTTNDGAPEVLKEAMRYSLLAPGKRLRPFLVHRSCQLVGGDAESAFAPGAALEMVHAFSLIHDDLPAMDNDDLRRGLPTNHKKFGEATAILAGDGLLALAFETLSGCVGDPVKAVALTAELARGTGWCGMIGGQVADLLGESQRPDLSTVRNIHARKTGALIRAACRMGGIAGGAVSGEIERLGEFGRRLGLAFQIADDILDVSSTSDRLGKTAGKDAAQRKQTYPACVGLSASRAAAGEEIEAAIQALDGFGPAADDLRALARYCLAREA
jgi:geranylgeranyl pyrophosphate synthase